ncbi:type IV pilin N-terminal domain-containing protein [Halomicroarcula sp. F13]|uniref:Type IV pilin N-terminal domain-containing protein n=1 Tax=Haloarcula rubra TaxID=2487747 RepID=A0AAW4PRK9_9EURY|nr:type IV pilin N-terminal domain-containing protein [Halomicroarcula rubra]MBX0323891.1 type IV pilin N-terminal domain-containing protein [Halomicroarcula rubra]
MDLKALINDDDAVSPVIGVILMVAITVILAAVIASFVLGLGDQAQQTTPQASFSFDYESSSHSLGGTTYDGYLDVTHDGGDSISIDEVYIRGSGSNTTDSWANIGSSTSTNSEVAAGNSLTLSTQNDYNIRVVYQSQEGDNSATLGQDSGPEA